MFNLGGGEILVILLLALIVLGPQRLPEAARKVGNVVGEVRRMATGFQSEIKAAFDEVESAARATPTTSPQKAIAPMQADGPGTDTVEAADEAPADATPADATADATPADATADATPADEAPGRDDAVA
jgi:sec-independent protein translocase protein TatB